MPQHDAVTPDQAEALLAQWADVRSRIERSGDVTAEDFATVMDLDRATGLIASYRHRHPRHDHAPNSAEHWRRRRYGDLATAAAALIACQVLMGWSDSTLKHIVNRGYGVGLPQLRTATCAFLAAYLSGASLMACDEAFEAELPEASAEER